MENFVVSARKYRPVTFDSVVGQGSITSTLKNSIKNNHLAQAFLFTGPRGVGKTTCARIFAKTINCENLDKDTLEPCDKCESCVSFNQHNSFNIHELDAASNNSVEDIRRLVEQVRIPPQVGEYKVYIIDEVHMLSTSAFNAFLKTLEEPPSYAKFILATTEKHKIIPTILSRCQIYDFNRITVKDAADHLAFVAKSEGVDAEEAALLTMAQKADGAMRDALSIFDQIVSFSGKKITYQDTIDNLNILDIEYYFQLVDLFLKGDIAKTLNIFNHIISKGFDGLHFINGLATHLRNVLVSKDEKTVNLLETSNSIQLQYAKQAKYCSLRFLVFSIEICTKVDIDYRMASDKRLLVELNLMKMCKLETPFEQVSTTPLPEKKNPEVSNEPTNRPTNQDITKQTIINKAEIINKPQVVNVPANPAHAAPNEAKAPLQDNSILEKTNTTSNSETSKTISKRRRSRGISIKDGLKESIKEEEVNLADALSQSFDNVENIISKEDFEASITKYRVSIKKEHPAFSSALEITNIEIRSNNTVHIKLSNDAMNNIEFKYDMLSFLKDDLKNKQIAITTEVKIVEVVATVTSKDKYFEMVKENPNLDELRKQLDLDFKS